MIRTELAIWMILILTDSHVYKPFLLFCLWNSVLLLFVIFHVVLCICEGINNEMK